MKLIWITPECPYPANTGGRVGIWKRIQYISENNDIYLFSIIDSEKERDYQSEIKEYCREVKLYPRCNKFKALFNSIMKPFPASSRWNIKLKKDLERYYKGINPDFIIIDLPQMIGALPQNMLESGKLILNQHNIEFQALKSLADGIDNPIKRCIYKLVSKQMERYEKKIYLKNYISLYTFVSTKDKLFFEENYKKTNTFLVPVGVEITDYKETNISSCNMIFVAKMSYPANEKGAKWLMNEIVPIVKKSVPNMKLYLVGKDPGVSLIEASKNDESIIVTGTVDLLEPYYNACNVATVPIMTGGGVNVKLLEALGQGKYVITTSKGIEGTNLKHLKHVLVADKSEIFAEYCIELLVNPEKYLAMKKRVFKIVEEEYSWRGIVKSFENRLRELHNEN